MADEDKRKPTHKTRNLAGANLEGVRNLSQEQLDEACGDDGTRFDDGLTIPPCEALTFELCVYMREPDKWHYDKFS